MEIEKLIEQANCFGMELKRDGGEFEYSIGEKFLDYATTLSALQAENAQMEKQLSEFSSFLSHMTGNRLSKTNYTAKGMIVASEDYQQEVCEECDVKAALDDMARRNDDLLADLEKVKTERDEAREAICTHCQDVPCRGESCYWWRSQKEG